MKKEVIISLICLSLLVFAVPQPVPVEASQHQTDPGEEFKGGLIPCGYVDETTGEFNECGFDDFIVLVQTIINFLVAVSIPLAVILFTYAGVLYLTDTGKEQNVTKAKKIMTSTVIGFLIVISAWLVVRTIVGHLLDTSTFENPLEESTDERNVEGS